jgi:hypothetical protein
MPGRSALCGAVNESAEWETSEHLLAALIDELALSNYMFQKVNFKAEPNVPQPVKRPGSDKEKDKGSTTKPRNLKPQLKEFASPQKVASVFASLQF